MKDRKAFLALLMNAPIGMITGIFRTNLDLKEFDKFMAESPEYSELKVFLEHEGQAYSLVFKNTEQNDHNIIASDEAITLMLGKKDELSINLMIENKIVDHGMFGQFTAINGEFSMNGAKASA